MSKQAERVSNICTNNQQLKALAKRAQQLKQLNLVFQSALPTEFEAHCRLVNVNEHTLIVHTDNAAYASLLRFQAATLCQALSAHLPQTIDKLDVKVRPLFIPTKPIKLPERLLSNTASNTLQQTADFLEQGHLKTALEKLAKRSQKLN